MIGIVGAGPAGARAAELLARQGHQVALFDPYAPWEKPCGGGLTPSAFDEMPELEELKELARPVSSVRMEADPPGGVVVALSRPMWILSREELGRWQLHRAVEAGAMHWRTRVRSIEGEPDGWRLETDEGEVRVDYLVGADGAASLARRVLAPEFKVELAPTRVAYPGDAGPTPDRALLRFYHGTAAYLWDFPRPGNRSVGVYVPRGTWRRPTMDAEIEGYVRSRDAGGPSDPSWAGAVIGTAGYGHGDFGCLAGPGFALLGDAAGLADPFTGEGIQNALRSAGLLARAWARGDPASYPALARNAFAGEFHLARLLRRALFESGAGLRLLRWGAGSPTAYGVVAALLDALNEHDAHAVRLARRWRRARESAVTALSRPRPLG
jgi:flavin-dependent dehydrogenase